MFCLFWPQSLFSDDEFWREVQVMSIPFLSSVAIDYMNGDASPRTIVKEKAELQMISAG